MDYNDMYDRLITLYSNPLDLNSVDRAGLQSLFFLSEEQVTAVMDYRRTYGKFLTEYELLTIEGFDTETVERIMPFVTVVVNAKESLRSG